MTRRARTRIARWLVPALLMLVVAGCGHADALSLPWQRSAPPPGLSLTDIHDVGDLQHTFNQDAGKPRLILLVSPT